jgi:hypothetical protein
MRALEDRREVEEAASRERTLARWLAASEPLAVDDDPEWDDASADLWLDDDAA